MREKSERIKAIQDAAKKVFFKKGFQNAKIEEIARLAEVSKGTIYIYFKNKDDLYTSIILQGIERLRKRLLNFENGFDHGMFKNSADVVMGFLNLNFEHYAENPDSLKIYQSFQLNNLFLSLSKENYERINAAGVENFRIARRIIAKAIEMNLFPHLNPAQVIDVIWAVFLGNVQIGESKALFTKKNFLKHNLDLSFSLLSRGIEALEFHSPGSKKISPEEDRFVKPGLGKFSH